jgi:hypothetical protein
MGLSLERLTGVRVSNRQHDESEDDGQEYEIAHGRLVDTALVDTIKASARDIKKT